MVSAFLLVKIEGGSKIDSMDHVTKRPEVRKLTWVLGPYDVIIECELSSMDALGGFAREVRACPGVSESITCLAVD
jgi:DNA-binding Lrp family transcriptional regulator